MSYRDSARSGSARRRVCCAAPRTVSQTRPSQRGRSETLLRWGPAPGPNRRFSAGSPTVGDGGRPRPIARERVGGAPAHPASAISLSSSASFPFVLTARVLDLFHGADHP